LSENRLKRSAGRMERIAIAHRVCDLCSDSVTSSDHVVTKSFILMDWGVICVECWDNRIGHYEEFSLIKIYPKSLRVEDKWIEIPLVFVSESERNPKAKGRSRGR